MICNLNLISLRKGALKVQLKEFFKYLCVSLICLIADYFSYWVLSSYKIASIPISSVLGYSLGLFVSYFLLKENIFSNGWLQNNRLYEFILFLTSGGLGIFVTYIISSICVMVYGENIHGAKISSIVVSFLCVFLFRKKVVFRAPTQEAI